MERKQAEAYWRGLHNRQKVAHEGALLAHRLGDNSRIVFSRLVHAWAWYRNQERQALEYALNMQQAQALGL